MRPGLTAQVMVRNEPFVYYAVKSVYDFVDAILLYDTGSNDGLTMEGIQLLISEDTDKKIKFKAVSMDVDETQYSLRTLREYQILSRGKRNKVDIRNEQIDDTDTEFFLLVDGDEVHYRDGIAGIANYMNAFPADKVCGIIPEIWFCDLTHTMNVYSRVGRIFRTNEVRTSGDSPDERHVNKSTGKVLNRKSLEVVGLDVKPFAHFSPYLKPWRLERTDSQEFKGTLPEVMIENDYFIRKVEER